MKIIFMWMPFWSLLYSLLNFLRNKFRSVTIYHQQKSRHYSTLGNKLDDLFPSAQFILKNFGIPYRLDRNSNSGRLLLYVRDDIPSMFLKVKSDWNIESIYLEVNLRKRKGFINDTIIIAFYQTILSVLIAS